VSRFAALRSRDFRLLFLGQLLSLAGSQMQQVAVAWQIYELTHSPMALGLVGAFRVIPVLLFALGGGVVADAVDRRRLMLLSQTAMALVSLSLGLLTRSGHIHPWAIYALLSVGGLALAVDSPARQALIPLLVPRQDLGNALSLHAMAWQLAAVAGPSLAGLILAKAGVEPLYFIDAVSFLAVIAALLSMRIREAPKPTGGVSLSAAMDGLRFLARTPLILQTMVLDAVATFLGGSIMLIPIFVDQVIHLDKAWVGAFYAAQPTGAALAAIIMSSLALKPRGSIILWSVATYGAAVALFGLSRSLVAALLFLAVSGAADTVSMVSRQTLRQLLTPDELRGRMTSVNMIFFMGGPQLGEVEGGIVARLFNVRVSIVSGGIGCVLAAALVAATSPKLRRWVYGIDSGARS
jgi:MFS family permease